MQILLLKNFDLIMVIKKLFDVSTAFIPYEGALCYASRCGATKHFILGYPLYFFKERLLGNVVGERLNNNVH